jgi:signal transduction histidine kinase
MRRIRTATYWKLFLRVIRRYLEQKIQRRMVLNFVGLGVLPILIVSFLLIRLTENTVTSYIFQRNLEIARGSSNEISLFLEEPVTILNTISQTRDIIEMERFTQSRVINKIKISNPLFQKIFILDQTGLAVVTTSFGEELKDYSKQDFFSAAMAGNRFFSPLYFTPSRYPAMSIALPIMKYNTVEGVLVGEIDLKNIWAIVDSIKVGKTGFAFLISSDGLLIAHPDKQKVLNKELSYANYQFYPQVMKGEEGISSYVEDGQEMIAAFIPIHNLNWGIVVQQSKNEAFELVRKIRNQVTIFVSITSILAVALALGTIRRIARPIETLVKGVRQYADGNLKHRIKVERQDELMVLAVEFNKMAESLEKNQRQLRRMERLAAISRFASLVSHEIRNPLNAMNINMQILRRFITQADSPPDKKLKYMNIISSEIDRMNSMVSNFLAITRPPELTLIRSDIHQIVEEVVITLEGQAKRMGIGVNRHYHPEPLSGLFDHNQLKQVFHNILLNAFEAMPDGGSVMIQTSRLKLHRKNQNPDSRLQVRVVDSGIGIPIQKLVEIFELYYTTKKTGTGLGLAIAKQIVEAHGGEIKIESVEGQGTTVIVELPVENEFENKK